MGHFTLPAISISIRKQKDDLSPGSAEVSSLSSLCSVGSSELIGRKFVCYRAPNLIGASCQFVSPTWAAEKVNRKTKRPRLIESWDARRTALPRSLLNNRLTLEAWGGNGPDGLLRKCLISQAGNSTRCSLAWIRTTKGASPVLHYCVVHGIAAKQQASRTVWII